MSRWCRYHYHHYHHILWNRHKHQQQPYRLIHFFFFIIIVYYSVHCYIIYNYRNNHVQNNDKLMIVPQHNDNNNKFQQVLSNSNNNKQQSSRSSKSDTTTTQHQHVVVSNDTNKRMMMNIESILEPHERLIYESIHHNRSNSSIISNIFPPLNKLINESNHTIINNVNFLLDFAIIGFGKCGTSSIMNWLRSSSDEIQMFPIEISELLHSRPINLIQLLYNQLPHNNEYNIYKRGYKSPNEINEIHVLDYYRTIFPKTKLIIGIRNPIRYFESLYNFRIQNYYITYHNNNNNNMNMSQFPKPIHLIGKCTAGMYNICTDKANFASHLIHLGKHYNDSKNNTMISSLEKRIMNRYNHHQSSSINISYNMNPIPNPIFIYELEQLHDTNHTRHDIFRYDIEQFLNVTKPLSSFIPHEKPGIQYKDKLLQEHLNQYKINICDHEHIHIRRELLYIAQDTSLWIRTVLLLQQNHNNNGVYVSSREHFKTLLKLWMDDPCGNTKKTMTITYKGPKVKQQQQ